MALPRNRRNPAGRLRATQWPMVVGLMVLWMLLWGTFSLANVVTGLLIGVVVCVIFPLPPIETQLRLHPLGFVRFAAFFLADMLMSSWRLIPYILAAGPPPCRVIGVRMRCPGDLMLTLTAVAISAVPGSTVLEVHRATGTLYLHVMGAPGERARRDALRLESRVVRAFGTREDIKAVRSGGSEARWAGPAGASDGSGGSGTGSAERGAG